MFSFDAHTNRYPSRRSVIFGKNGMVAASQPLAAQAGLDILKQGGSAADAAVAAAACLTVVEPTSNGIGGDAFAIVWSGGELHGLNASGHAPAAADADALRARGLKSMPLYGWDCVTVPGAPSAWAEIVRKFGKLSLASVLTPAINYAQNGFPVSPTVAKLWERAFGVFAKNLRGGEYKHIFDTFCPAGKAPAPGELWRCGAQAETLRRIAESGAKAFYSGEIAEKIDAFSRACGGALRIEDLASYSPEWVKPVGVNYRGTDVWEIPPNGQGITALIALNILKRFDLSERESARSYHLQIEAVKLAFADSLSCVADPRYMNVTVEELLSEEHAESRAKLISEERAGCPFSGGADSGGTVYLAAADGEGNMVSMIQSNYRGFGSGLAVPGTGVTLHNRGNNFSLDPDSPNCLAPGKKPYHTIIPGFMTKNGRPVGPFGVMGAFMQPQGHVQVVTNLLDFGLNPQEALDAPRWQWLEGRRAGLEQSVSRAIANKLKDMGHDIRIDCDPVSYGRGQIIMRSENGVLAGATEPRCDGQIAVF